MEEGETSTLFSLCCAPASPIDERFQKIKVHPIGQANKSLAQDMGYVMGAYDTLKCVIC